MEKKFLYFVLVNYIFISLFLFSFTNCQMTILPDGYKARDSYYLDDISNPSEVDKHIYFAYLLNNAASTAGYKDEYSGVYYTPNRVCWNTVNFGTTSAGYANYNFAASLSPSVLTNLSNTNLQEIFKSRVSRATDGMWCQLKFFYDNPSYFFYLTLKIVNANDSPSSIDFDINLFSIDLTTTHTIESITLSSNRNLDYVLRFKVNSSGVISYSRSTNSFSTTVNASTGGKIYFDNNNYATRTMIIGITTTSSPSTSVASLSSILLTSTVPSDVRTKSGSTDNDCSFGRPCVDGTYCNPSMFACMLCEEQCKDCYSNSPNDCKSCFATSPSFHSTLSPGAKCPFDFVDLTKYQDITINVPVPFTYRVTVNFWMFIHDTTKMINPFLEPSMLSIVIKDFVSIAFFHSSTTTSLDMHCIPMENLYSINGHVKKSLFSVANGQYTSDTITTASSKWLFIKCAYSFIHNQMYINSVTPKTLNKHDYYGTSNMLTFLKKFYRTGDTTTMTIKGFNFLQTEIYIRNLNLFSEYLPQTMDLKYHNLHKLDSMDKFPQLLFSLPLDDLSQDGTPPVKIATTTFYDFSNQSGSNKKTSTITLIFSGTTLRPPRNFKRIKFLDPGLKYSNADLSSTTAITCTTDNNCWEDNKAFFCKSGTHLNISTFACASSCPAGFTRLPQLKTTLSSSICNYPCPTGGTCPSTNTQLTNLNVNFSCSASYFKAFYQCFSTASYSSNSAIQFSGTLNTRSIVIDLNTSRTNFIIEMWIHPDLLYQNIPPLVNSYLLLTNNHQIFYDSISKKYKLSVKVGVTTKTYDISENLYYYGWNHIVLSNTLVNSATDTKLQVSFKNNFFDSSGNSIGYLPGTTVEINKICFCNIDTGDKYCGMTTPITWMDVWIKDLRVWDGNYATVWSALDYLKYSTSTPAFLLHYFLFNIANIDGDQIKDQINQTTIFAKVPFDTDTTFNPDLDNSFNYGWNFSWNDQNPNKYAIAKVGNINSAQVTNSNSCNTACSMCWGNQFDQCFACNPGYALVGNMCKSTSNNTGSGFYYFINPTSNPPVKLSLNISGLNLSVYPALTIFFFLKVFGFTTTASSTKIIIFDSANTFDLFYNSATRAISLEYNGVVQYTYANYQEKYFGVWVPISIALFRSPNLGLQPNMSQMTIDDTLLPKLAATDPNYGVTEISFPRGFIGMVAEIRLYSTFIVNAWGLVQHPNSSPILSDSPMIYNFSMKSSTSGQNCLSATELSPSTASSIGLVCVADYLPHLDQTCSDNQLVTIDSNNYNLARCTSNQCMCTSQCVKSMETCDWTLSTCTNSTPNFINNLLYNYTDKSGNNYIICGSQNGLDLARYGKGVVPNIQSPTDTFKMEFWFFSKSYVGVQFTTLEVSWDKHIKILINYINPNYVASCYPVIDVNNSSNDGTPLTAVLGSTSGQWYYIVCGVDITKMKFFISSSKAITYKEQSFTTLNSIASTSTLTLLDKSIINYGATYVRELRLWKCYNCNMQLSYVTYNKENLRFSQVLHYFDLLNPAGVVSDMSSGSASTSITTTISPRLGFWGYNLLPTGVALPNCIEDNFFYFNQNTNLGCDRMYNLNILDDVVFPSIPVARANRWTIELWIYIQSANDFTSGINIIYENHMSISLQADSIESNDVMTYCLPQAYRDRVKNLYGQNMLLKFNNALNKAKEVKSSMFSNWIYLKCAFDLDREVYHFNSNPETKLLSEKFYHSFADGTSSLISNIAPLKFFIPKDRYTNIIVQGAGLNNSRIFMRSLNVYREYIPQIMDLKFRAMKFFVGLNYWPLVFAVDFNDFDLNYRGLKYYYNDHDTNKSSSTFLYSFLGNIYSKSYLTYPAYTILVFCNEKQKYFNGVCVNINSSPTCDTTTFCYDDNKFFWCAAGFYLDPFSNTCNRSCPSGFTRMPDSPASVGMCLFQCDSKLYASCPSSADTLLQNQYSSYSNFKCVTGFTRVYNKCYSNSIINNSAIFFSNSFSFLNTMINFGKNRTKNYYVEAWIMLDNFFPLNYDTNYYTYFIAYPHKIIRTTSDKRFKYANEYISNGNTLFDLPSWNFFEWNRIIIKNSLVLTSNNNVYSNYWDISVYINNKFAVPDVQTIVSGTADLSLFGIAFCSIEDNCRLGVDGDSRQVVVNSWGSAYYRNIKVWNFNSANLYSLIYTDNNPLDLTDNMISYYKMTIDSIQGSNIISQISSPSNDIKISYNYANTYDDNLRVNYAANFDISVNFNKTFVSNINSNFNATYGNNSNNYNYAANYTLSNCNSDCKRCYYNDASSCYACDTTSNKILIGRKCYHTTASYLKMPAGNLTVPSVILNSTLQNDVLATVNPITINFYMKFIGVNLNYPSYSASNNIIPILNFMEKFNFFGWDTSLKQFSIYYNQNVKVLSYSNSNNYISRWTHFGISIYNAKIDFKGSVIFPNMINFMIDKNLVPPIPTFDIQNTVIRISTLSLSNQVVAYFSRLRIYKAFYLGTFGLEQTQGISSTLSDLVLEFKFQSKDNSSSLCINDSELSNLNGASYGINCAYDYFENDDNSITCPMNSIKNINLLEKSTGTETTPDCLACNMTSCDTYCYGNTTKSCTCKFDSGNSWIRTENVKDFQGNSIQNYYCDKLDSLNVAYYQPIFIPKISMPGQEYKIELWVYLNSYMPRAFPGMNIFWNQFTRIEISYDPNLNLKVNCYPFSDSSNPSSYIFYVSDSFSLGSWQFIKCSVNKNLNTISLNSLASQQIKSKVPNLSGTETSLVISDNSVESYGIALVREIRLWTGSSYLFYDTSRINLNPGLYSNLLHYFKNYFPLGNSTVSASGYNYMLDSKTNIKTYLTKSQIVPGYNYIYNYTSLVLCEEGQTYNSKLNFCQSYSLNDFYSTLTNNNSTFTSEELLARSQITYQLAIDIRTEGLYQSNSLINPSNTVGTNLTLLDPTCNSDYCNNKGTCILVDKFAACYCFGGYFGAYCHLQSDNSTMLNNIYNTFWNKTIYTMAITNNSINTNILDSMSYLIRGSSKFMTDSTFLEIVINDISSFLNKNVINTILTDSVLINKFLSLIDNCFTQNVYRLNALKASKLKNLYPSGNGPRNVALYYNQKYEFESSFSSIRSLIEKFLLKIISQPSLVNSTYFNFYSDNFDIDIFPIDKSFNFTIFFKNKLSNSVNIYRPYFDMKKCIDSFSNPDSYNYWVLFITWFNSPYMYDENLYWNYTSPMITVKVFDQSGNLVNITNCEEHPITFYMTVSNPLIINTINSKRNLLLEGNRYLSTDPIFTQPYYIDSTGYVSNTTRQERIDSYYIPIRMTYNYYNSSQESFLPDGLSYFNYSDTNYMICYASHLTDLMLNYLPNPAIGDEDPRLYYLGYLQIFINGGNYIFNCGFFISIFHLILYVTLFVILNKFHKKSFYEKGLTLILEEQFMRYIYPYGNLEATIKIREKIETAREPFKNENTRNNLDLEKNISPTDVNDRNRQKFENDEDEIVDAIEDGLQNKKFNRESNSKKKIISKNIKNDKICRNSANSKNKAKNKNIQNLYSRVKKSRQQKEIENIDRRDLSDDEKSNFEEFQNDYEEKIIVEDYEVVAAPDIKRNKRLNLMFGRPKNEVDPYAKADTLHLSQNNLKNQKPSSNMSKEINSNRKKNTKLKNLKSKEDKSRKSNLKSEEENLSLEDPNIQVDNQLDAEENQNTQINENPFDLDNSQIINENPNLEHTKYNRKKHKSHNNNFIESVDKINNKISGQSFDPEKPKKQLQVPPKEFIITRKVLDQRLEVYNWASRRRDLESMNLNFCQFFFKNIRNRHMLLTTILDATPLYPFYLRLFYLMFYLNSNLLLHTLAHLYNPEFEFPDILYNPFNLLMYSICIPIIINILMYFISCIFYINRGKLRLMYKNLKKDQNKFEEEWEQFVNKRKIMIIIVNTLLGYYWILTFFFSFGVCAAYQKQSLGLLLSYFISLFIDLVLLFIISEGLIALIYVFRRKTTCIPLLDNLNRLKSFKLLSP